MRIDVVGLFPEIVDAGTAVGVVGRARERGILELVGHQLRDHTGGSPHPVDDAPYGGGPGMVLRPEPVAAALDAVTDSVGRTHRILLTPQGRRLDQARVRELATIENLVLFCGRYEGIDERVRTLFDEELSVGDYVLSGGEPAALVLVDAVARLLPGVLGSADSTAEESFSDAATLEYPQYTRPAEFRGMAVPPVLTSGNHAAGSLAAARSGLRSRVRSTACVRRHSATAAGAAAKERKRRG